MSIDELILQLERMFHWWYVFGCVMYADDVLLLSASVNGLQLMINACSTYGDKH